MALRHPAPVLERVVGEPDETGMQVAGFHSRFDRRVVSGDAVMREYAVAPVEKRSVLKRVFVSVRLIVERVPRRLVEAAKGKNAQTLIAERAFHFRSAVERSDVGRVENVVGNGRNCRRGRTRAGVCVDEVGSLGEEGPVLDELPLEFLRSDGLLIDFHVGEIGSDRADEAHRRRERIADVESERPHFHRQKLSVGLLKKIAIFPDAGQSKDVRPSSGPRFACRTDGYTACRRPPARVVKRRPSAGGGILHEAVVRPYVVFGVAGQGANELNPPGLLRAAADLEHLERNDEDGGPAVGADGRGCLPARPVPRILCGLLIVHAPRRRLEVVCLRARTAGVDADADEIVHAEADVVGRLGRNDRPRILGGLEGHVKKAVVVQKVSGRLIGSGTARRHVFPRAVARDLTGRPAGIAEGWVERKRMCGPGHRKRKLLAHCGV